MKIEEYRKWECVLIAITLLYIAFLGFLVGVGITLEYPQQIYNNFIGKGETYVVLPAEKGDSN